MKTRREADKVYLIDQQVVITRENNTDTIAGFFEFDDRPFLSLDGRILKNLANHFNVTVVRRGESHYAKGEKKWYEVPLESEDHPLVIQSYHHDFRQISKIEAFTDGPVLCLRITYHDGEGNNFSYEITYHGKFEVWWKPDWEKDRGQTQNP